jgi:diguanylate cyclase (GGDEF)-like protein
VDRAALVSQRIYDQSAGKIVLDERRTVTISMGLASHPECVATNAAQLIKFADLALYEAKRSGRNRASVYTAGH